MFMPRQKPEEPFIFLPRKESNFPKETSDQRFPQIIPMPYPVPMGGNQGNNQGGFNVGRAIGALAGYFGMGFGDPAFTPGPILSGRYSDLMKEKTFPDILSQLPDGEQGPAQGPNTPIQMYPGMGYGPVGPAGGGLPPTPMPDLAEMPRFIRGNYRPGGVFGSPPPNLDSPYMDEQIRRGFVPMTPPVRSPGPQLPGFV
jgi:hypothetical protein